VPKNRNMVRAGAVALTSVGVLVVGGGSAWGAAAAPASLSEIQAKAAAAITLRVNDLNSAIAKVEADKDLGSEQSTLVAYLQADIAPLQTLGQKIAADTTVATASADAATIFTNFRVLALVLPAAWVAADSTSIVNWAVPALTTGLNKARSHVNSENQGTLDPLIADLSNQITAATNSATGIASTVLSYTPSDWNSNNSVLAPSHASVQSARNDVKAGRSDLQQIWNYLKSDGTSNSTASSTGSAT
jgi:hypothetical protein